MIEYSDDLPPGAPEIAADLREATTRFFFWREEGQLLTFGGEMIRDMISTEMFLWISLMPLTRRQVFTGLRLARGYLEQSSGTVYAECALDAPRDERFLKALDFVPIFNYDDRILYRRRT